MNIKEYGTRMDVIMIYGEDKLYNDSQKTWLHKLMWRS